MTNTCILSYRQWYQNYI